MKPLSYLACRSLLCCARSHASNARIRARAGIFLLFGTACLVGLAGAQEPKYSSKPPLHGQHWMAVTGKPLAATAGAMIFNQGGNAVDAAAAMLAASATMWDSLGWGGETQALIYHPGEQRVIAINALGAAPSGATPEFYRSQGMDYPPDNGPLAAVTPGTPGGLLVMLAEYGSMSLEEVLAPAMRMAEGYPMERVQTEAIEYQKYTLMQWPDSSRVFLPNYDPDDPFAWAAPQPGETFSQPELHATLGKLISAEREALAAGLDRKAAIMVAYERFYRGDIAEELVQATQAAGGLITMDDLDQWQVHIEEPVSTTYKGIDVYKLNSWVQGPVMLQMLNMLEDHDLQAMGHNSTEYIHTLYQVMNLAFADRDFYYGDPYFPPYTPITGLLSKDYARERSATINPDQNDPAVRPGDPYPFQGESNPFADLLAEWEPLLRPRRRAALEQPLGKGGPEAGALANLMSHDEGFLAGTTSIQAADAEGWLVSITPSGAWIPAFIAGNTGIGLSQRLQSFDMDAARNPYNVMEPGKRPRSTLTPGIALKDGKPFLAFGVQGGDTQDQNLLQFLLNIVEFGMDVQQASEAGNINSYQTHSSFGAGYSEPGRLLLRNDINFGVLRELHAMGYRVETAELTSGPITGILIDPEYGTFWGGASDYGDDTGIGW